VVLYQEKAKIILPVIGLLSFCSIFALHDMSFPDDGCC
jgi:hypothetical protein